FANVRRVDDHFAAVGHCGLDLVHALAGRPDVGVHRRHHGHDRLHRPSSHTMCRLDDSAAASCHTARASPKYKPAVPSAVTTRPKHEVGTFTIDAARSITARTGV